MEHILSLSYGKDSLACLGAIEELGWPLDRIVHAEVWATDTIPADLPPMVEFKKKADAIIKGRWGLDVEHVSSGVTIEDGFYFKRGRTGRRTKFAGEMYGWPMRKGQWCLQQLKLPALSKAQVKGKAIQYIGIAVDEPNRFHNLTDAKKSPLLEANWTESMCREWCEKNDLLSPIYTTATRGGCWFCHNQSVNQLRLLRKNYPEYWELMLKWDKDSPVTFHAGGHTVHDFERRFQLEDDRLILADDKAFRWKMYEDDYAKGFQTALLAVLRCKTISHPPNDPLTLEELREMDGEPVWVEMFVKKLKSHWAIVHGKYLSDGRFTDDKERCLLSIEKNSGYGLAFLAYRRKPEEGQT